MSDDKTSRPDAPGAERPAPNSAAVEALPPELQGRYERRGVLGQGGQSVVLRAWDNQLDREVAIKELKAGYTPLAAERFLREARIGARLEHPNIVPVHEIGKRRDGTLYCVQKLVSSDQQSGKPRTLRHALFEAKNLDERLRLLPSFVALCHAIAYAHEQDVLHRDLKPENVVLGRFGATMVLDWGLARAKGDSSRPELHQSDDLLQTVAGIAYGTPPYMSPEQVGGETITLDRRTDVWSLGAMLFELLTGRTPFVGANADELFAQIRGAPLPDARALEPAAPPELVAVAARALQKDRARRFASAQEMADEVVAWQTGRRVTVYDYSLLELAKLFVARHRVATLVTAAALFAVTASAALAVQRYNETLRSRSLLLVQRAREATQALQFGQAAVLYAHARASDQNPITDWGARISRARPIAAPLRLPGHGAGAYAVAFSPDGQGLVTAASDGVLRRFSLPGGALATQAQRHRGPIKALDWSKDGALLVSGGEDGRVVLSDARTLEHRQELRHGAHAVNAVSLSADGRHLAIGTEDGQLELYALPEGTLMAQKQVSPNPVYGVRINPRRDALVWVDWRGVVQVTDFALFPLFETTAASMRGAAWSPDGAMLATGSRDRLVRLFRPFEENKAGTVLDGHTSKVMAVSFSPDGTTLFSASTDLTVRAWDPVGQRLRAALSFAADAPIAGVAVAPDGKTLAVAQASDDVLVRTFHNDPAVLLWGTRQEAVSGAPGSPYVLVHRVADVALIDSRTAQPAMLFEASSAVAGDVSLSRDGAWAAYFCAEAALCWTRTEKGAAPQRVELRLAAEAPHLNRPNELRAVAIASGARWVAAADWAGRIQLVDPNQPQAAAVELGQHVSTVFSLDASADGTLLASGAYDRTVQVWDVAKRSPLLKLPEHSAAVRRVRFSPDGRRLATAAWDGSVRLFEARTGKALCVAMGHDDAALGLDWAPDGTWFATAGRDGTLRVWNAGDCSPLAVAAADAEAFGLAVAGDGRSLWYTGYGLYRLELAEPGSPLEDVRTVEAGTGLTLVGAEVVRKSAAR